MPHKMSLRKAHVPVNDPYKPPLLQIAQVVASLDAEEAGPSYSVPRLSRALAEHGHVVTLLSVTSGGRNPLGNEGNTLPYDDRRYFWQFRSLPIIGKLGVLTGPCTGLCSSRRGRRTCSIRTGYGDWPMSIQPALRAAPIDRWYCLREVCWHRRRLRSRRCRRGSFGGWGRRKPQAAVSVFHATSEAEYEDIRAYKFKQPVAVIPNGIDVPALFPQEEIDVDIPTVLFLGRLHPVKALDRLVSAWYKLGEYQSGWRLRIVGPVEQGYDAELRSQIVHYGLSNVELLGPVQGQEKWRVMQAAEIFVLPSLSENFAIAVAESLAMGTPVIASRGTPWRELETHGCGWWVSNSVDDLTQALATAMSKSKVEREAMGMQGREWMGRSFSWSGVATEMTAVYRWILSGGEPPGLCKSGMMWCSFSFCI